MNFRLVPSALIGFFLQLIYNILYVHVLVHFLTVQVSTCIKKTGVVYFLCVENFVPVFISLTQRISRHYLATKQAAWWGLFGLSVVVSSINPVPWLLAHLAQSREVAGSG